MEIVYDVETIGVNIHNPEFKILFDGILYNNRIIQKLNFINSFDPLGSFLLICHNIKFETKTLLKRNIDIERFSLYDTMIAFHLIRGDLKDCYSLESLVKSFYQFPNYKGLIDFTINYWEDIELLKLYNRHDLRLTKQLKYLTEPILKREGLYPLFIMMMDYIKVLSALEMKGIKFDEQELTQQGASYIAKESKLLEYLRNISPLDWQSPKQVRAYFEGIGVRLPKTKKGNPSTSESNLSKLKDNEIVRNLLELRGVQKQLHTYIKGIKNALINNIYYPDYNLLLDTGRLSEHYIQVLPRKEVSDFKKCIISKFEGGELLECDWSQLEIRLEAEEANETRLIKDLESGYDLHKETLEKFPFLPNRTRAKNVNFSVFFGGKGYTLEHDYGLTKEQSKAIRYNLLDERYPEIKDYFNTCEYEIMKYGYVTAITGRKGWTNSFTEAYNRKIQGNGSDWNKIMTIKLTKALEKFESHIIMDVHDALIIDIHPKEKEEVLLIAKKTYINIKEWFYEYFKKELKLSYPTEFKIGKNLYEMEKING